MYKNLYSMKYPEGQGKEELNDSKTIKIILKIIIVKDAKEKVMNSCSNSVEIKRHMPCK